MSRIRKHFYLSLIEMSVLLVFLLSTKDWSVRMLNPVSYIFYTIPFTVLLIVSNHRLVIYQKNTTALFAAIPIGILNSFFCLCISVIIFQKSIIVFFEKVSHVGVISFLESYFYRSLLLGWWVLPFLILLINKILFKTKIESNM